MSGAKEQAARTAADSLKAIEAWSKRTFIAAVCAAAFTGMLASGMVFAGVQYIRITWALQEGLNAASDAFMEGVGGKFGAPLTEKQILARRKSPF
ncbi:unnamed protein product [uncultured bacterium]|nr:unnamed protein product [uncultured bacterium]